MYKLVVINRFGVATEIRGNDLERLKIIAKRMNENGADVEIVEEVSRFRIVSINK